MRIRSTKALSERQHQIRLVRYARWLKIPLVHNANEGKRSAKEGAILKMMGMSNGYPDCFAPMARGGYFGIYIEVKLNKKYSKSEMNKQTWLDQDAWLVYLNENNYFARRAFGWEHGVEILKQYHSWPLTPFTRRSTYDVARYAEQNYRPLNPT